jgi:hypothetical protein
MGSLISSRVSGSSVALVGATLLSGTALALDPLPSWNDGPAKRSIVEFVARVTAMKGCAQLRVFRWR